MRRVLAIAATLVLAAPTLALAQFQQGGPGHNNKGAPARGAAPQHAAPRGPAGGNGQAFHGPAGGNGPAFHRAPIGHGPVVGGPVHGPVRVGVGPGGSPFVFHGHPINRVRFGRPWVYPPGWGYRRWAVGAVLPALFLAPAYYYANWADVGLSPPPPGFQWVQYGPDLLLVNVTTGEVVDVAYGVFY
jgi:Ni/Co efflux regulator RcnB